MKTWWLDRLPLAPYMALERIDLSRTYTEVSSVTSIVYPIISQVLGFDEFSFSIAEPDYSISALGTAGKWLLLVI